MTIFKDREEKPKSAFVCFDHPESKPYALLNGICSYGRSINMQHLFGSSCSSESTNQSPESCIKTHSPGTGMEKCGQIFLSYAVFFFQLIMLFYLKNIFSFREFSVTCVKLSPAASLLPDGSAN